MEDKENDDKVRFLMYVRWIDGVRDILTPEQFKKYILAISDYASKGILPDFKNSDDPNDKYVDGYFKMAQPVIDSNNKKYKRRCEASRENGKLGGRPKKQKEQNENNTNVEDYENTIKEKMQEYGFFNPKLQHYISTYLSSRGFLKDSQIDIVLNDLKNRFSNDEIRIKALEYTISSKSNSVCLPKGEKINLDQPLKNLKDDLPF